MGYVDNWDYWTDPDNEPYQVEEDLGTTDLSFSPGFLLNSRIDVEPVKNLHVNLLHEVCGEAVSSIIHPPEQRSLDPYFINDLGISYSFFPQFHERN